MEDTLKQTGPAINSSIVIPRSGHNISRNQISENALKVLYRLKKSGFDAYLVGGGVRDLLLGRQPKDFDVATNAHPEEVRRLFRNCRLIGRRFRLAHIHFRGEIIEVATYRAGLAEEDRDGDDLHVKDGRILRDNVYGTMEEDAWRRDFTVNALYYNIRDFSVVDYTGGLQDLDAGVLRLIGDTEKRFQEDAVRMLRAVRFATKLGFLIDPEVEEAMRKLGYLLEYIPPARLFEETLKLFMSGCGLQNLEALRHHNLFGHLFPVTEAALEEDQESSEFLLMACAMRNTDARVAAGKPVTPAFLMASLLWPAVCHRLAEYREQGLSDLQGLQTAGSEVAALQVERVSLPRRFSVVMREIWAMQSRLHHTSGGRPHRLLSHPQFRAAYDFLLLRAEAGEDLGALCDWWTRFQEVPEAERKTMTRPARKPGRRRRKPAARSQPPPAVESSE